MNNELYKALERISLGNASGEISDAYLEKACTAYKTRSEFVDDYAYNVKVTKSLYDHLHGNTPDPDIQKAIMPGQTKVVNGVMYIYTATPNAKTAYDWRVYQGKKKIGAMPTGTKKLGASPAEMFPADPSELTFKEALADGAELMTDAQGREFVVKEQDKKPNLTRGTLVREYYASQIYSLLGLETADYELYEDNGKLTLIRPYIRGLKKAMVVNDADALAKGFAVDALLNNWSAYAPDHSLVDAAGKVYRINLGGTFDSDGRGGKKPFGGHVDWDGMVNHNQVIVANLKTQDFIDQLDALIAKKDEILDYLKTGVLEEKVKLRDILDQRFDDLKRIRGQYQTLAARQNRVVKPRKLKSDAEMYRDFTEDELNALWANMPGSGWYSKCMDTGRTGWELLSEICRERGFNDRPEVKDDTEFWKDVAKAKYHILRGVDAKGNDKEYFSDEFKYSDTCYYGTLGVHGEGIYFHVNDGEQSNTTPSGYQKSSAYRGARSYAGYNGAVIEAVMHPSAKVINTKDARAEIMKMVSSTDPKVKAAKDAETKAKEDYDKVVDELDHLTESTEAKVKADMHWDQHTYVDIPLQIDQLIDWGAIDDEGRPDYLPFDDFMKNHLTGWITSSGGTIREKVPGSGTYVIKLPNTNEQFMFSRYRYENNAIKRKNSMARPYNYPVRQLKEWIMREHFGKIDEAVKKAVSELGDTTVKLQKEANRLNQVYRDAKDAVKAALSKAKGNPDSDIYSAIYEGTNRGHKELLGVWAALKGYDALIEDHGNGGPHSFMIVLNRSKVIVKK